MYSYALQDLSMQRNNFIAYIIIIRRDGLPCSRHIIASISSRLFYIYRYRERKNGATCFFFFFFFLTVCNVVLIVFLSLSFFLSRETRQREDQRC